MILLKLYIATVNRNQGMINFLYMCALVYIICTSSYIAVATCLALHRRYEHKLEDSVKKIKVSLDTTIQNIH